MNFLNELRSNYRLRIGLALIVGIVWLSLLLDLREQNSAQIDQYRQTASQLARFDSQQKQTQWVTRAQEATGALTKAESRLWQNPTLGMTQAEMRDWLLQQLQQAKATRFAVKVSESGDERGENKNNGKSDDAPAGLVRVRAKLEFNTDSVALNSLLGALANAERQIVVESLTVKQPRTELTVAAWYKLQPVAPASDAQPSTVAK